MHVFDLEACPFRSGDVNQSFLSYQKVYAENIFMSSRLRSRYLYLLTQRARWFSKADTPCSLIKNAKRFFAEWWVVPKGKGLKLA